MTTKEKILEEALILFAAKGYDGTGVDEIAEQAGIKGPSLYKHYKGKEGILNALIDSAEERYEEYFGSDRHIGKIPESKEEFIKTALNRISFTMSDPMITRMRRFLVQEQFRSERLAEITTRHQQDGLVRMYTMIIEAMMQKGLFKKDDPVMLAIELTSPVVLWIAKSDRQPDLKKKILENMEKHLRHFCDVYMC